MIKKEISIIEKVKKKDVKKERKQEKKGKNGSSDCNRKKSVIKNEG